MLELGFGGVVFIFVAVVLAAGGLFVTVNQGTVGVITMLSILPRSEKAMSFF